MRGIPPSSGGRLCADLEAEAVIFGFEHVTACRVALKSETLRVRGYFLPLTMRFDCHRAYAFRALPGDVINRGK